MQLRTLLGALIAMATGLAVLGGENALLRQPSEQPHRRIKPCWSYKMMHEQADLVVIAKPISTTGTSERAVLPNISPDVHVVGVQTEFNVRVVLKGETATKKIVLHHYRLASVENGRVRGAPHLVSFDGEQRQCCLLFLKKETDGRYAPLTGQTDPGDDSVISLASDAN